MGRDLDKERVSLNQIKRYVGNPGLKRKTGLALIDSFLPKWSEDPFETVRSAPSTVSTNVNQFCSGNRKQGRLGNVGELDLIIHKLTYDNDFVDEALRRSRICVEGTPPIKKDSLVFTQLVPVLRSNDDISSATDREFDVIERTIETLRKQNTPDCLAYALFLLVIVGVLQERIVEVPAIYSTERQSIPQLEALLSKCGVSMGVATKVADAESPIGEGISEGLWTPHQGGYMFVFDAIQRYSNEEIESIDMAFHGGDHWLRDGEKVDLLEKILDRGIHLRIIVNTKEAVDLICSHMRQRRRKYMGFDNAINAWKEWESDFPGLIDVRISDIPLLHRVYLIRKKDGTGVANITCYTYGNYTPKNDIRLYFNENDPAFLVFAKEFEYLWDLAGK